MQECIQDTPFCRASDELFTFKLSELIHIVVNHLVALTGALAAGVPSALRGYQELHQKFGRLRWSDLFQPTIDLCENGFTVDKRLEENFIGMKAEIEKSPTFK